MSQNPMPFSGHQTPNPTATHFRGSGGVSKRLYNTSTQPRNISHHNHPPYFERRHNLIDDMGLEIGSYNNSISRSFNNDSNPIIDGRATSASLRISSNHQFHSHSEQNTINQGQGRIICIDLYIITSIRIDSLNFLEIILLSLF